MADNYYSQKLNSQRLYQVYQTEIERVRQYLDAEIDFVRGRLRGCESVLEVGAGYGRIMKKLAPFAVSVTGIDISDDSVAFGREYLKGAANCRLERMDAHALDFAPEFDVVLCLQNGLSAIKGDSRAFVGQCMRVLRPGGAGFFSTYSARFWEHRLAWFEEQAAKGLLGEIDYTLTGNGVIVCKDGFTATTLSADELAELGRAFGSGYSLQEVDESSLFLIIEK